MGVTLARKIVGRNHQRGECVQDGVIRRRAVPGAIHEKGAKRCLRTHPSTVTAGLLPLGPDPVRLDPPRLETAFRPRSLRSKTQGADYSAQQPPWQASDDAIADFPNNTCNFKVRHACNDNSVGKKDLILRRADEGDPLRRWATVV